MLSRTRVLIAVAPALAKGPVYTSLDSDRHVANVLAALRKLPAR